MDAALLHLQAMAPDSLDAAPGPWLIVAALMVGMTGVAVLRHLFRKLLHEDETAEGHALRTKLGASTGGGLGDSDSHGPHHGRGRGRPQNVRQ